MLTRRQRWLLLIPFVALVVPFLICPALFGLAASLTTYTPFRPSVEWVGLKNLLGLVSGGLFQTALLNGLRFVPITVGAELIAGLLLALALRRPFRGRGLIRFTLLLPWLISPAASGVMWGQLLVASHGLVNFWPAQLGIPNTRDILLPETVFALLVLTEVWRKAPLVTFLALPALSAIPADRWDTARLDGLGWIGQTRHVALPAMRGLLLAVTLLLIGDAWGTSESVLFLTGGGPGTRTLLPGLYAFNMAVNARNWSNGAAAGWLMTAALLIIGLIYLRLARSSESRDGR